jgi:ABC-type branched-subunit amino acid transport system ATPase component
MNEPLLQVQDVEAGYEGRPVLHGVSLSLAPGEIVALVGPNGAGKSTLLKAIFGLVGITRGTILYRGSGIQNRRASDNVKEGLSYLLQGSRVFAELSVQENLEVGGHVLPRREVRSRIQEVLDFLPELRDLRKRNAGALSTGQRQMLAVGRALMLRPALILADEPSLGLGPQLVRAALDCLRRLNTEHGTAVILVEQNVKEALTVAQRLYVLRLGRVVVTERPENLTLEALRSAFLG